jgi:hypothetical protein
MVKVPYQTDQNVQIRGAREIDERRRTYPVRWSEAIERNEAGWGFFTGPTRFPMRRALDEDRGYRAAHRQED